MKPGDLFDLDFQLSPILTAVNGQPAVIGSGKLGRVFAFDRGSGEIIWETAVGEHQNDELTEIPVDEITVVMPGVLGGVETPMALADGVIYAAVNNMSSPYTADAFGAADGTEAVGNVEARTNFEEGSSEFYAIDANSGEVLWTVAFEHINFGGATVVNDLVFTTTYDGTIYALARDDGQIVWSYAAPGGINAWPAVAGDTILFAAGVAGEPVLIAFRLGAEGEVELPPQPQQPEDQQP